MLAEPLSVSLDRSERSSVGRSVSSNANTEKPMLAHRDLISQLTTGVLVVCAVTVTVVTVRRQAIEPPQRGRVRVESQPDWRTYAATGHRLGAENARAIIVEFGDF